MATFASVNDRRAQNWWKNAIKYRWMKLFPGGRDNHLWLFSAWEGEKYADNSKYLFEYMLSAHPEIQCIWQTRSESIFMMLKKEGKPVQLIGTKEATETQRKAGVVLYTNGLDDFGDFPDIYGATIVALWHGAGFKKGYRMLYKSESIIKRLLSSMRWSFFSWVSRDITIVTSEYHKNQMIAYFDLPANSTILVAGQARNDVFAEKPRIEEVIITRQILDKIGDKTLLLYMPTFRENSKNIIMQIEKIFESEELEEILKRNNAALVVKLHYLNQGQLGSRESKILLNDSDVLDSQKLLACADFMITDYSSCTVDFALTHRPILYCLLDWDEYHAEEKMMPETLKACEINCAHSSEEFIIKVNELLTNPAKGLRQSEELNMYYDETGVMPGQFAENVFKQINDAIKTSVGQMRSVIS